MRIQRLSVRIDEFTLYFKSIERNNKAPNLGSAAILVYSLHLTSEVFLSSVSSSEIKIGFVFFFFRRIGLIVGVRARGSMNRFSSTPRKSNHTKLTKKTQSILFVSLSACLKFGTVSPFPWEEQNMTSHCRFMTFQLWDAPCACSRNKREKTIFIGFQNPFNRRQ